MNNSTLPPTDCQIFYCPMCGSPLTMEIQERHRLSTRPPLVQLTCDVLGCQAYRCTTSDNSVLDGSFVAAWKFKSRFNPLTGESLISEEIEALKCANNLILIVADDPVLTAAYAEDTRTQDPVTLLSVLRDWYQVLQKGEAGQ